MFAHLVDMMRHFLETNNDFTPTELREAAMLAATMYEYQHIRPIILTRDDQVRFAPMMPRCGAKSPTTPEVGGGAYECQLEVGHKGKHLASPFGGSWE
jgi:hypothetical protein